jgi:arginine repressor
MARPTINIPITEDLKSIKTLLSEGLNQTQIAEYYTQRGYPIDQRSVSRKIKEAGLSDK